VGCCRATLVWARVGVGLNWLNQVNAMAAKFSLLQVLLLAAPAVVLAQATPPAPAAAFFADGLSITPQNGQNPQQQSGDRGDCETWSKGQTGFDVTQPTGGVASSEFASRRDQFNRAMTACLSARGYSVRVAAPASPPPAAYPPPRYVPPAPPPPAYVTRYSPPVPTLAYHPFSASVSGGWSITAGNTSNFLDDGGLFGVGFSFFPSPSVPVGVRLDGSYTWFGARDGFLIANNAQLGHQDVYGGDADLQFNLGTHASRAQFYVFGGAGWYREQTVLHQVSGFTGSGCGFFFCGPADFFGISATERSTTPWRDSWNAGLGWEFAIANGARFFVEGRYREIGPSGSREQFVPIQAGFRF
jgi:hypothetical protein